MKKFITSMGILLATFSLLACQAKETEIDKTTAFEKANNIGKHLNKSFPKTVTVRELHSTEVYYPQGINYRDYDAKKVVTSRTCDHVFDFDKAYMYSREDIYQSKEYTSKSNEEKQHQVEMWDFRKNKKNYHAEYHVFYQGKENGSKEEESIKESTKSTEEIKDSISDSINNFLLIQKDEENFLNLEEYYLKTFQQYEGTRLYYNESLVTPTRTYAYKSNGQAGNISIEVKETVTYTKEQHASPDINIMHNGHIASTTHNMLLVATIKDYYKLSLQLHTDSLTIDTYGRHYCEAAQNYQIDIEGKAFITYPEIEIVN